MINFHLYGFYTPSVCVCACYLGDLDGVPSALLGSISLCSCFCKAILSDACLHDKHATHMTDLTLRQLLCFSKNTEV